MGCGRLASTGRGLTAFVRPDRAMIGLYFEDILIERPAIALFAALGWQTTDCFDKVLNYE
jgi:hypothetical protein